MKLHREGKTIIRTAFLVLFVLLVADYFLIDILWLQAVLIAPFAVLFLLILWFFRIPTRELPVENSHVIAPADGKIVVIEKTFEPEYFKDERIQISIFMSPLNIHQNVYPVSGEVRYTKYHEGKYLVAWHPKSSTENERATVVVETDTGTEVLFRQIAGAVARRICSYAKVGDNARKGSEFGFIKFGSRVDVFLPLDAKILCSVGDKSVNKQTVLAELI
ncbi:MAG: phosphatidylserine decarboxylase family protein [Bacteroidales bacterium]|nr:phosphatidylserine decarboxylase family protein [Bacteroidales bacterium]MBN2818220.1 phosphatidylserine decarboxylase family protein [Bacteroidales bacterium]